MEENKIIIYKPAPIINTYPSRTQLIIRIVRSPTYQFWLELQGLGGRRWT